MQPERSEFSIVILGNGVGFNYVLIGANKLMAIEALFYSDIFEIFQISTYEDNLLKNYLTTSIIEFFIVLHKLKK